jgi:hypothetical protein
MELNDIVRWKYTNSDNMITIMNIMELVFIVVLSFQKRFNSIHIMHALGEKYNFLGQIDNDFSPILTYGWKWRLYA